MNAQATLPALAPPAAKRWPVVVRTAVSVLLLIYVFRAFHWADLRDQLRSAQLGWMLVAWLFFGLPIVFTSVRWNLLLRVQGLKITLARVFAITCVGQFFNTFLLGATGGDVVKVYYVTRRAPGTSARVIVSILVDRAIGLGMLAIVCLAAASSDWPLLMSRPELQRLVWILAAVVAALVLGGAALVLAPLEKMLRIVPLPERMVSLALDFQRAAVQYARVPRISLAAAALTIPVHIANLAGGYFAAKALGIGIGFGSIAVILGMVFFVISIPVSISGHGVRESIFVLMFSMFGVGSSVALAYSLSYFGLMAGWSLACFPVYWAYRGETE